MGTSRTQLVLGPGPPVRPSPIPHLSFSIANLSPPLPSHSSTGTRGGAVRRRCRGRAQTPAQASLFPYRRVAKKPRHASCLKVPACGIPSSTHLAVKHLLLARQHPRAPAQASGSRSPPWPCRAGDRRGSLRPCWSSSTAPSTSSLPLSTAARTSPLLVSAP